MSPTQPEEQRQVRQNLRAILQNVKDRRHELAVDADGIKSIIQQANEQLELVSRPHEEALDAEVFAIVAEQGVEYARKLADGGKSYGPADLVRRLKAKYVQDVDAQVAGRDDPFAFQWSDVGRCVADWLRPAPICFHMLGPMDAAPKAKRVAPAGQRRTRREPVGDAVRPTVVTIGGTAIAVDGKQETDKNMEEMWKLLRNRKGERAPLVELVMNHQSFAQTVENMFTLSFLVRDGRVQLLEDNDGDGVYVKVWHKKGAGAGDGGSNAQEHDKAERVQFIVAFSMEDWETWKLICDPNETLMPHRQPPSGAAAAAAAVEGAGVRRRQRDTIDCGDGDGADAGPSSKRKKS